MNRVTKLIHKAWFLKRQRRAINFGHKFTISDLDIENAETQASKRLIQKESVNEDILSVDRDKILEQLLDGFDPVQNKADRRILFELTGLRLYDGEFKDCETSSDDDDEGCDSDEDSTIGALNGN